MTVATIHGARGEEWAGVLGVETVRVPVKSASPFWAKVPGRPGPSLVYLIDLEKLPEGWLDTIVDHMARKFGLSFAECFDELAQVGIPVLADDVSVMTDEVWFL